MVKILEDKELLLRDLCARLPYGVICTDNRHGASKATEIDVESGVIYLFDVDEYVSVEVCRPYLRPMSSMTEEELYEASSIIGKQVELRDDYINIIDSSLKHLSYKELKALFDWLNAHHFDYRGLIEKGLALPASEEMYKID